MSTQTPEKSSDSDIRILESTSGGSMTNNPKDAATEVDARVKAVSKDADACEILGDNLAGIEGWTEAVLRVADATDAASGVYRVSLGDETVQRLAGVMRDSYAEEPEWSIQVVARAVVAALRSGAVQ